MHLINNNSLRLHKPSQDNFTSQNSLEETETSTSKMEYGTTYRNFGNYGVRDMGTILLTQVGPESGCDVCHFDVSSFHKFWMFVSACIKFKVLICFVICQKTLK